MNLADLRSYIEAQAAVDREFRDQDTWTRKAAINIARTGKFSSDRTIAQYAQEIWGVKPVPIEPRG